MEIKSQKIGLNIHNHIFTVSSPFVIVMGIICILCLALATCGFGQYLNKSVEYYSTTEMGDMNATIGSIESGVEIIQVLDVPYDTLKSISLYFLFDNGTSTDECAHVNAGLYVNDALMQEWEWDLSESNLGNETNLVCYAPVNVKSADVYLKLVLTGETTKIPVTIKSTSRQNEGTCLVNGEDTKRTLYLTIKGSREPLFGRLFAFSVFVYTVLFLMLYNAIFNNSFKGKNVIDKCIVISCIGACCLFFSQYEDMNIISELSYQLVRCIREGQLLNFYEYALANSEYPANANYNILLYIVVAVIKLPILALNKLGAAVSNDFTIVYINIILGLIFGVSGKLFKKLLLVWNIDQKTAEAAELVYFLNPILLFASIGFEQLDITYIVVFLIALYFYSVNRMDAFAVIISVSIAMKSFPILIFIPLILLKEKRLIYIVRYFIEGMLATLIFHFIYGTSEGWITVQGHYDFIGNLFEDQFPLDRGTGSVFCLLYVIFCFACYFHDSMETWKNIFVCGIVVYTIFALFTWWGPQYLTVLGVFLSMGILVFRDRMKFFAIMFFASLGYIIYSMLMFGNVDNKMFYHGVLFWGADREYNGIDLGYFINQFFGFEHTFIVIHTIFAAAVLFIAGMSVFYTKKYQKIEGIEQSTFYRGYLYLPLLPLWGIMILSAAINLSV